MNDGGVALLEWAKFLASLLTPIAVVAIGYFLNVRLRAIEEQRWLNQKVIEKRLDQFEKVAPWLNDLFCYFTYVGGWKDLTPPKIIEKKRELDKEMHIHAPLFPAQLHDGYEAFMDTCFATYGGYGKDARLRTGYKIRKQVMGADWQTAWDDGFLLGDVNDDPDRAAKGARREAYAALMAAFAAALGVSDR